MATLGTCKGSKSQAHWALMLPRRLACLLTAVSLLPVLALGPLGSGIIVIHDHHEAELHLHRVFTFSSGQPAAVDGHDHPTSTVDLEGAQFVLALPDLPRLCTQVQSASLHAKLTSSILAVPGGFSQQASLTPARLGVGVWRAAPLRAHDTMTGLLLSGHSLLI